MPINNKVIISSVANFTQLLINNPALLQIESFKKLLPLMQKGVVTPKTKCSSCSKRYVTNNRGAFETSLDLLSLADKKKIKEILKVQEVCYYIKKGDKLNLSCF